MNQNLIFSARFALVKLQRRFIALKNNKKNYYSVFWGRRTRIYNSWSDCNCEIHGLTSGKFKKFLSLESEEFPNCRKNYMSSKQELVKFNMNEDESKNQQRVKNHNETMKCEKLSPKIQTSFFKNCNMVEDLSCCSSSTATTSQQNLLNFLALTLRLDAFEKRFDECLKDVGGIMSELSHIKTQLKEIKGIVSLGSNSQSADSKKERHRNRASIDDDIDCGEPSMKKFKTSHSKSLNEAVVSKNFTPVGSTDDINGRSLFNIDKDGYVIVYTDGACHLNGKTGAKAGIGVWFGDSHPLNVSEPANGNPTNNVAEIQAARVAIETAINAGVKKLKIHTDSELLINCITKWIHRWKKNDWTLADGKSVKNKEEIEKLYSLTTQLSVRWEKVEGHAGIKGNEMADRLAREGALKIKNS